jgi:hypothetical protein
MIPLFSFVDQCNSNAQYIGKLDQWGFKKNSTDEKWKFIARTLEKRELDGKESDTYINGKLVPRKRVKKEVSRHCLPSWQATAMTGMRCANLVQSIRQQ